MDDYEYKPAHVKSIRIMVPVSLEVDQIVDKYAHAIGSTKGRVIADWMHETREALGFVANSLFKARSAPKEVARELHAYALAMTEDTTEVMERIQELGKANSVKFEVPKKFTKGLPRAEAPQRGEERKRRG